jgi:hypothetical protein
MSSVPPARLADIFAQNIPPACIAEPGAAFLGQIRGHAPFLSSPVQFANYWRLSLPLFYLSCGAEALSFDADHPAVRWLMELWAQGMDLLHALSGDPFPGSLGPYGTFLDDPLSPVAIIVREAVMGPLLKAISEYLRPAVPNPVAVPPRPGPRVTIRAPMQPPSRPPVPAPRAAAPQGAAPARASQSATHAQPRGASAPTPAQRAAPSAPAPAPPQPAQRAPGAAPTPSRYVLIRHARIPLAARRARGLTPAQATQLDQLIRSALLAYGFPSLPRRTEVEVLQQSGDVRLSFATVDLARAFMGEEHRRVAPRASTPGRPGGAVTAVYCSEPDPLVALFRSMLSLTAGSDPARDAPTAAPARSTASARRRRRNRSRHHSRGASGRASPASTGPPPNEAGSQVQTPASPVAPSGPPTCTINELLDIDLGQAVQRSRTASERCSPPSSPETAARPAKRATPTPQASAPPTPVPPPPASYADAVRSPPRSPPQQPVPDASGTGASSDAKASL